MVTFTDSLRRFWLWMIVPPWRHRALGAYASSYHWAFWLIGWSWAFAGLAAGALVAPTLVQFAGLLDIPYQDVLVIGIAVVAGFLVQLLGWCLVMTITASFVRFLPRLAGAVINYDLRSNAMWMPTAVEAPRRIVYYVILGVLPLAGVGYALYRYLALVGASQRSVSIAFVGAFLFNTILFPFVKTTLAGVALNLLIRWLRGGKDTKKAA